MHDPTTADGVDAKPSQLLAQLEREPVKQGKPLQDELQGYYNVRAAEQRSRIIYELEEVKDLVVIVVIGIRKEGDRRNVYRSARKRLAGEI